MVTLSQVDKKGAGLRWRMGRQNVKLEVSDPWGDEEITLVLTPDMMRSIAIWWANVDPGR